MNRRRWISTALVTATAVAAAGLVWFEPHKLLIDDTVDEAVPAGSSASTTAAPNNAGGDEPAPSTPTVVRRGEFRSLAHTTTGEAQILDVGDGRFVLRLENLRTDNGPDLKVYLSPHPGDADDSAFGRDFLDLGELKGNIGSQNYDIPLGTDVSRFDSAVVWCRRFRVGFGVAPLA